MKKKITFKKLLRFILVRPTLLIGLLALIIGNIVCYNINDRLLEPKTIILLCFLIGIGWNSKIVK